MSNVVFKKEDNFLVKQFDSASAWSDEQKVINVKTIKNIITYRLLTISGDGWCSILTKLLGHNTK